MWNDRYLLSEPSRICHHLSHLSDKGEILGALGVPGASV